MAARLHAVCAPGTHCRGARPSAAAMSRRLMVAPPGNECQVRICPARHHESTPDTE